MAEKKKHKRGLHESFVPREKRYVCIFCGMIFGQFIEIDRHFTEYHKLDNYRDCCFDK